MIAPPYKTPTADAVVHLSGWVRLASGILVTALPLVVRGEAELLAHIDYRQASIVALREGAELIDYDTVTELHETARAAGTELEPVTLPDQEMIAAHARTHGPRPPNSLAAAQRAWDVALYAPMATIEWCRKADGRIFSKLRGRTWDGLDGQATHPVAGAGKHFQKGAPQGRCYIRGWWDEKLQRFIQAGVPPEHVGTDLGPHGWWQHDYGTTTVLMKRAA